MKIKVVYRKSLKMSPGKLSAQVCHAVLGLGVSGVAHKIIVLEARDTKFWEQVKENQAYVHHDAGFTEVDKDEVTCAAWVEDERYNIYKQLPSSNFIFQQLPNQKGRK